MVRYLITGGAGFMGSNYVRYVARKYEDAEILVYDKLTYAGRVENLKDVLDGSRVRLIKGDICDEESLAKVFKNFEPEVIVNFAAETHVDRSINEPAPFLKTNVFGVFNILEAVRRFGAGRLIHISSDEVYGDMWGKEPATEDSPFRPSSPYSASKAAGDHLALSYWRTYGVPVIVARPSNNYGPYQHPEKLIPKTIIRALTGTPIPIYGSGDQVRDWLYVRDFCEAIDTLVNKGVVGEPYNIPGGNERTNLEVVKAILKILGRPETLIKHVEDRPGHDRRYAMRGDKIAALGWRPRTPWGEGLRETVEWYLRNEWWWRPLTKDEFFRKDTPWR